MGRTTALGNSQQNSGQTSSSTFQLYDHPVYGKYLKGSDFGVDETGKTDSRAAIQAALAVAHQQKAALHLG
ncbi:MAG: hypothetical protein HXJ92_02560, partial [candidate division SR1 bacterium]|nr:hypothetical protein [candidate division SR1 bacterium]